jgi:hypothetical protein
VANTISPKKFVPASTAYITASSGVRYRTSVANGSTTFDVITYPFISIKNPGSTAALSFDLTKFDTNFFAMWYVEFVPGGQSISFAGTSVSAGAVTINFEGGSQPSNSSSYNVFQCWTDDGIVVNVRKMIGY